MDQRRVYELPVRHQYNPKLISLDPKIESQRGVNGSTDIENHRDYHPALIPFNAEVYRRHVCSRPSRFLPYPYVSHVRGYCTGPWGY